MNKADPQCDVYQQAFYVGTLVGKAACMSSTTPGALQRQLAAEISGYLADSRVQEQVGQWDTFWGPATWQAEGSNVLDNAMVVLARTGVLYPDGKRRDTFVVGIAGTNAPSGFDWISEDLAVKKVVDFNSFKPFDGPPTPAAATEANPVIALATATGVYQLAQLKAPFHGQSKNLAQLLQGLRGVKDAVLIFVGHSLGGAMAPTLAQSLQQNGQIGDFGAKYVYPTAGPTPGNKAFADAFQASFPATEPGEKPYAVWNTMLWNTYDAVPHSWHVDDLKQIKNLFGAPAPDPIPGYVNKGILASKASGIVYTRIPNKPLQGSLHPTQPSASADIDWEKQAGWQHTVAYGILLGLTPIKVEVPVQPDVHVMTSDEISDSVQQWLNDHPIQGS
jgi:hypothetical protein